MSWSCVVETKDETHDAAYTVYEDVINYQQQGLSYLGIFIRENAGVEWEVNKGKA